MAADAAVALRRAHAALAEGAAISKRTIAAQKRTLREHREAMKELEATAQALGLTLHIDDTDQEVIVDHE